MQSFISFFARYTEESYYTIILFQVLLDTQKNLAVQGNPKSSFRFPNVTIGKQTQLQETSACYFVEEFSKTETQCKPILPSPSPPPPTHQD